MARHSQQLLQKYLQGRCTQEELAQLYHEMQRGELKEFEHLMQQVWDEMQNHPSLADEDSQRIYQQIERQIKPSSRKARVRALVTYTSVAASLVLLMAAAVYWWSQAEYIAVSTAYQETKTVSLPDGTEVTLNASSSIRYPADIDQLDSREVWVKGEAFFSVNSLTGGEDHKKVPFTVHTQVLDIQVLGTQFNVKERNGKAEVVLKEGKIRLSHLQSPEQKQLDMEPGQKVLADSESGLKLSEVDDPELYSSWQHNELYFEDESLGDIALELQNHYGIQVQFSEQALRDLKFTGSVPSRELEVLFISLEKSFNLKVEQDQETYLISKQTSP